MCLHWQGYLLCKPENVCACVHHRGCCIRMLRAVGRSTCVRWQEYLLCKPENVSACVQHCGCCNRVLRTAGSLTYLRWHMPRLAGICTVESWNCQCLCSPLWLPQQDAENSWQFDVFAATLSKCYQCGSLWQPCLLWGPATVSACVHHGGCCNRMPRTVGSLTCLRWQMPRLATRSPCWATTSSNRLVSSRPTP